jgi:exosortase
LFVLFSIALFAGMSNVLRDLVAYASGWSKHNASQVLIVPLITATLIFLSRKTIFRHVQYDIGWGALIMLVGGSLLAFAQTRNLNLEEGDELAFTLFPVLVIWWGGFVLFYGVRAFKESLFPLLFLLFCLPIPSALMNASISFLQHASADVAYVILKITGMPIYRDDVIFTLPGLTVEVAPECSGIRSAISLVILSLLTGNMALHSWQRKLVLVLAAIPVSIFKNALRISTLSFLAIHIDHRILTSRLHREGGIPFFVAALLLMYPILTYLIRSEKRPALPSSLVREVES